MERKKRNEFTNQTPNQWILHLLKEQSNLLNKECQEFQSEINQLFHTANINKSTQNKFIQLCSDYSLSLNRICVDYITKFESSNRSLNNSSANAQYSSTTNNKLESSSSLAVVPVPDLELNEVQFKCDICHKTFHNKAGLNSHKAAKHASSDHQCAICDKQFASGSALGGHMSVHRNNSNKYNKKARKKEVKPVLKKDHVCDECDASFTRRKKLFCHIRDVHDGLPWICNDCDEKFKYMQQLNRHRNSAHAIMKQNAFKCEDCAMRFASQEILNVHKLTHVSASCDLCHKTFANAGILRTHLVKIHNKNPWKCDQCTETFRLKGDLRKHEQTEHSESMNGDKNEENNDVKNERANSKKNSSSLWDIFSSPKKESSVKSDTDIVTTQESSCNVPRRSRPKFLFNRRL